MQNKTLHLPSNLPEGLGPRVHGFKATGLGPSVLTGCLSSWGLSPSAGTSNLGPWGFLKNEVRWYLLPKFW